MGCTSTVTDWKEKLLEFEMKCYSGILMVCWKDKVTNKIVRCTTAYLIKQGELKLFGYICRIEDVTKD